MCMALHVYIPNADLYATEVSQGIINEYVYEM
jgi:hypothetical protein